MSTNGRGSKPLTASQVRAFRRTILGWYRQHGRHALPWRQTIDPYAIVVSELMLQQTQVDRVLGKYQTFIRRFPTAATLARASTASVIRAWQGLGYNRRALFLQRAARAVVAAGNRWPETVADLEKLPGIGSYTARAVAAFAYNQPVVTIETNIRRVFIHHFFPKSQQVSDRRLLPLIEQTLDRRNARRWYAALMDYGALALRDLPNPNRRSRHYTRQSPFAGSLRQVRGAIIRAVSDQTPPRSAAWIARRANQPLATVKPLLVQLAGEGFIRLRGRGWVLAGRR